MKKHHLQSNPTFHLMSMKFRLRGWLRPKRLFSGGGAEGNVAIDRSSRPLPGRDTGCHSGCIHLPTKTTRRNGHER